MIADMVLSRMTGPQLVQEIRERDPSVPIIAVSGLPPERIWPCAADEDFPDGLVFAPKPIEWERFLRIVGTLASPAEA